MTYGVTKEHLITAYGQIIFDAPIIIHWSDSDSLGYLSTMINPGFTSVDKIFSTLGINSARAL